MNTFGSSQFSSFGDTLATGFFGGPQETGVSGQGTIMVNTFSDTGFSSFGVTGFSGFLTGTAQSGPDPRPITINTFGDSGFSSFGATGFSAFVTHSPQEGGVMQEGGISGTVPKCSGEITGGLTFEAHLGGVTPWAPGDHGVLPIPMGGELAAHWIFGTIATQIVLPGGQMGGASPGNRMASPLPTGIDASINGMTEVVFAPSPPSWGDAPATGAIYHTLPKGLAGKFDGTHDLSGVVKGKVPSPGGVWSSGGHVAAEVPSLRGAMAALVPVGSAIVSDSPMIKGSASASVIVVAGLNGTMPMPIFLSTGLQSVSGMVKAACTKGQPIFGLMGVVGISGNLHGIITPYGGEVAAAISTHGELSANIPVFAMHMTANHRPGQEFILRHQRNTVH